MKAVVVDSPNVVQVREVPEPVMGHYDVLCEVVAAGVCSATDNHIISGKHYEMEEFPLIPGHEGIGRVIACGEGVRRMKEGDIVTRVSNALPEESGYSLQHGAFAERALATDWRAMRSDGLHENEWRKYRVHEVLPKSIDPVGAVMIITWRETLAFLERMGLSPQSSALLIGSGTQALAMTEHAKNLGFSVDVIGSAGRAAAFKKFVTVGAYVRYDLMDESCSIENLRACGLKEKYDVIVDTIGKSAGLNSILPLLKNKGKVGVYGLDDITNYVVNTAKARGDFSFYDGRTYDEASVHETIVNLVAGGRLDHRFYTSQDHVYGLEKAAAALQAAKDRLVFKSIIVPRPA